MEVTNRHPVGLDECMKEAKAISDWNLALKIAMEELGPSKATAQNQMSPQVETTGPKTQGKITGKLNLKNVVVPGKEEFKEKKLHIED